MTTSDAIAGRDLKTLRTAVTGDVFAPGDHGYDEARQAWNLTTDERPAVVVMAESAADVVQTVRFARSRGMRIAPQGTGHGSEPLEPLEGAMLLRTVRMRSVHIDPDEVTSLGRILRLPPLPEVPEPLRGRAFALVEAAYLGDAGAGAALIQPLRQLSPDLDTFATIPASALQQLHMDPDQPVPNQGDGAFLADFPAAAIDALVAVAGPDGGTPLASIEVRHLGGALARPASSAGAQPKVDAKYLVFAGGLTPTPEAVDVVRAQVQVVKDALAAWHAGYDYYNFEETPAPASAVLPPASYQRLQKIKAGYDPDQAIISAHPVWPVRDVP
jgi:FAD binding domain